MTSFVYIDNSFGLSKWIMINGEWCTIDIVRGLDVVFVQEASPTKFNAVVSRDTAQTRKFRVGQHKKHVRIILLQMQLVSHEC